MIQDNKKPVLNGLALVAAAGAWTAGILLGEVGHFAPLVPLGGAGCMALLAVLLWHNRQGRLLALFALCLCLGVWRYCLAAPENDPQSILFFTGTAPVHVRGSIVEMPQVYGRSRDLTIETTGIKRSNTGHWENTHGRIEVQVLAEGATFEDAYGVNYGDVLELYGKLQPPQSHSSRSILASMTFPAVSIKEHGGNPLIVFLYHLRARLAEMIQRTLPQPAAAVLIGIVLGLKTPALRPLNTAFTITSTIHLLVTSGSNITLLAALVTTSTRWLSPSAKQALLPAEKRRDWRRLLVTTLVIICIVTYTVVSGAGIPAVRAGIMGVLVAIAPRLGRRYNMYTALAFTLILMSLFDPFVLWDTGFQLSYLSTAGIVLLTPYIKHLFRALQRLPGGGMIAENAAITLAAQITTLPIFAVTFQQVSLISPLANILAVPIVEILLPLGLLLCACGLLCAPLAILCGWVAWPLLWCLITVVTWCARLPFAAVPIGNLDSLVAWGYYCLLGLIFYVLVRTRPLSSTPALLPRAGLSPKVWRGARYGIALLIVGITGLQALFPSPVDGISVTFFSVGSLNHPPQGQAILIRAPGKTVLIDGGPDATSLAQALDSRLPSWQRTLDIVLLTCPRGEHIGGLQDSIERYTVGMVIDGGMLHPTTTYARWRRTISKRNLPYATVSKGATIPLGEGTTLQILWPPRPLHKGSNEVRDNGLVLRLVAPGLRLLLLGASAQSRYALAGLLAQQNTQMLRADIVQMVGENTKPPPDELVELMHRARPTWLVLSPAAQPRSTSAPPSAPVVATYAGHDLPREHVIATAQSGTIEIVNNKRNWNIYGADE